MKTKPMGTQVEGKTRITIQRSLQKQWQAKDAEVMFALLSDLADAVRRGTVIDRQTSIEAIMRFVDEHRHQKDD